MAPSSTSAAAMNSRWSADSSTNEKTVEMPRVSATREVRRGSSSRIATSAAKYSKEGGRWRIVKPHRHLGGEVLQEVPGQPELREHDQVRLVGPRLGEDRAV